MLDLYRNIKKRRLELGMSQANLAKLVGYTDRSMISKVESGAVDLSQTMIEKFANALQTDSGELMGNSNVNQIADNMLNIMTNNDLNQLIEVCQGLNERQIASLIDYAKYIEASGK